MPGTAETSDPGSIFNVQCADLYVYRSTAVFRKLDSDVIVNIVLGAINIAVYGPCCALLGLPRDSYSGHIGQRILQAITECECQLVACGLWIFICHHDKPEQLVPESRLCR